MKKVLALSLIFVMLFRLIASADEINKDNSIEQVLASVKTRIMSTDGFEVFKSQKNSTELDDNYSFFWETNNEKYSRLRVVVNSEDIITSYYYSSENHNYDEKPTVNKMTSYEAKDYALELIYALNPKLKGNIRIITPEYDQLYSRDYTFSLQRTYNGIDIYEDAGFVTISNDGKTIYDFYINYTSNLKFTTGEYLTKNEVVANYIEKMPLKLVYEISYNKEKSKTASLVYVPSEDYNTYISATDGEIFAPQQYSVYDTLSKNTAASGALKDEASREKIMLSEAEMTEINELNGLIGITEAERLIRENKSLELDSKLILKNSSVNHDYYEEGKYIYNMIFYSDTEADSVSVSCNAKTGEIINYYRYKTTDEADKITDEDAEKIAHEKVKEIAGKYFENENDMYVLTDSKNGNLVFSRKINGIMCNQNEIRISISKKDGLINTFTINHDNVVFPSKENVVSPNMIHKALFTDYEYSLKYVRSYSNEEKTYYAVAVYMFNNPYIKLDAFSGEKLGQSKEEKIEDYTDIKGHYAYDAVTTLRRFGIGFAGGKFEPDRIITIGEYLSLLNTVFDYGVTPVIFKAGYDYNSAYNYGVRREIIDKDEDVNSPLTREKACVMLIKALGYEDVAKLEDIYISKFSDVTENMGYISILCGMGIVNGDGNGMFNPDANLTRAAAAMMIYNYLSR